MKVLVLLTPNPGITFDQMKPLLEEEARRVWMAYKADIVREAHLMAERTGAVLVLEVPTLREAQAEAAELPLVKAGLLKIECIGLAPFGSVEFLFARQAP